MFLMVVCLAVLGVSIYFSKKINSQYTGITAEELENYQESVILHLDDIKDSYVKQMSKYNDTNMKDAVNKLENILDAIEKKEAELIEIEERVDRKLIQLKSYENLF